MINLFKFLQVANKNRVKNSEVVLSRVTIRPVNVFLDKAAKGRSKRYSLLTEQFLL